MKVHGGRFKSDSYVHVSSLHMFWWWLLYTNIYTHFFLTTASSDNQLNTTSGTHTYWRIVAHWMWAQQGAPGFTFNSETFLCATNNGWLYMCTFVHTWLYNIELYYMYASLVHAYMRATYCVYVYTSVVWAGYSLQWITGITTEVSQSMQVTSTIKLTVSGCGVQSIIWPVPLQLS